MLATEEKVIHGIRVRPRKMIRPKADMSFKTPQRKQEIMASVHRVLERHHKVFTALRDR